MALSSGISEPLRTPLDFEPRDVRPKDDASAAQKPAEGEEVQAAAGEEGEELFVGPLLPSYLSGNYEMPIIPVNTTARTSKRIAKDVFDLSMQPFLETLKARVKHDSEQRLQRDVQEFAKSYEAPAVKGSGKS